MTSAQSSSPRKELILECRRAQACLLRALASLVRHAEPELSAAIDKLTSDCNDSEATIDFENANQKATQYVNMISSVLKALNEVEEGVIKNLR